MDGHCSLIVIGRREGLRCLGRNRRVLLDQLRHDTTERLDTERQRSHVEQQHVLHFTSQHATLNACANRNGLIGVHVLARILTEEVLYVLLDERHARLAADQDDLGDIARGRTGILHRGATRNDGLLHQVLNNRLELRSRQLDVEMLRARRIGRDVRQVDVGLLGRGQLDFRLLRGLFQALHGERVLADIDAGFLEEFLGQEIDDAQVEVFATQEGVAVGREHFELALTVDFSNLDDGDIERAAAQVIHRDLAVLTLLVLAVGERCRGGLVDDALDLQARDAPGILGRLALRIVEVRRHGDHGLRDRLTEIILGCLLHLHEHARGDLLWGHLLALDLDPRIAVVGAHDLVRDHLDVPLHDLIVELTADETLDRKQRVLWVGHRLALRRLTDEYFAVLAECDDRRSGTVALAVLNHARLPTLHDGHAGIGGPEVDADYLSHWFTPQESILCSLAALVGCLPLPIQVEAIAKKGEFRPGAQTPFRGASATTLKR